jgi:hypothetical protein
VRLSSWFNYFIPQFKYIVQQFFANPAMAGFRVSRRHRNGTKTAQHKKNVPQSDKLRHVGFLVILFSGTSKRFLI